MRTKGRLATSFDSLQKPRSAVGAFVRPSSSQTEKIWTNGLLLMVNANACLPELLLTGHSRRLLQPNQSSIWVHHRVLFATFMPWDESYGRGSSSIVVFHYYKMLTICRFEYLWQDSEKFKKPTKMPAPEYVEHLMSWVQGNVDNEQMFPSRIGLFIMT